MTDKPAAPAPAEPVAWLVLDGDGQPEFAAGWEEAAHEHINDAINEHQIEDAARWCVRPVYTADQLRAAVEQIVAERDELQGALTESICKWREAERERDEARALLREARDWLASECLNEWPYMEGGRFYADRRDWLARIDAALATDHASAASPRACADAPPSLRRKVT